MICAPRVGEDSLLAVEVNGHVRPTALFDEVVKRCKDAGAQLLIVDTVADSFGGNENYRREVRTFLNLMRKIALEINGTLGLETHSIFTLTESPGSKVCASSLSTVKVTR